MDQEQLIQKYLQDELSESEHKDFLLKVENDNSFKQEVALITDLFQVNKKEELDHIQSVLKDAEDESENEEGKKSSWKGLVIAILLIIVAVSVYYLAKGSSSDAVIYASHYTTPLNTYFPVTRDGSTTNQELYDAFLSYEQKDFKKASDLFTGLANYDDNPEVQFYNAISLIQLGDDEEATENLKQITTDDEFLRNEILWYRALLAVKLGRKEEARTILKGGNNDPMPMKWQALLQSI